MITATEHRVVRFQPSIARDWVCACGWGHWNYLAMHNHIATGKDQPGGTRTLDTGEQP